MKAILLAAGLGTRLRPVTDSTPKCMVMIDGKPLLGWWFELLVKHGVSEVLVNTHYLPEAVREFIKQNNIRNNGLSAYEYYEPALLGSGGTVKANRDFVKNDDIFLICYADNLTNANLTALMDYHKTNMSVLTMALFRANIPSQCGIVSLDDDCLVTEFVEKPISPKSDLANAGIYAASNELFDYIPDTELVDFGKDVLPKLVGRMHGYLLDDYLLDIGTMENYEKAKREWTRDHI